MEVVKDISSVEVEVQGDPPSRAQIVEYLGNLRHSQNLCIQKITKIEMDVMSDKLKIGQLKDKFDEMKNMSEVLQWLMNIERMRFKQEPVPGAPEAQAAEARDVVNKIIAP